MSAFNISEATWLAIVAGLTVATVLAYLRRSWMFDVGLWMAFAGGETRKWKLSPPRRAIERSPRREPWVSEPFPPGSKDPNPEPRAPNRAPRRKRTFTPQARAAALENLVKARAAWAALTPEARRLASARGREAARQARRRRMPLQNVAAHPQVREMAPLLGLSPADFDRHLRLWEQWLRPETEAERACVHELGERSWQRLGLLRAHADEQAAAIEAMLRAAAEGNLVALPPAVALPRPGAPGVGHGELPWERGRCSEGALAQMLVDLAGDDVEFHQQLRQLARRLTKLGNRWLVLRGGMAPLPERPRRRRRAWRPNRASDTPWPSCPIQYAPAKHAASLAAGLAPERWPAERERELLENLRETCRERPGFGIGDSGFGKEESLEPGFGARDSGFGKEEFLVPTPRPQSHPCALPLRIPNPQSRIPEDHWARLLASAFGVSEDAARPAGGALGRRLAVWAEYGERETEHLRRRLENPGFGVRDSGFGKEGERPGFGIRDSGLGKEEFLIPTPPSPVPPLGAADANPESPIPNPGSKDSSFPKPETRIPNPDAPTPDPERPLLEALLVRGVSEELTAIEAAERQADFVAALYTMLAGAPLPPFDRTGQTVPERSDLPQPHSCWRDPELRRQMLAGARWLAETPWSAEDRERWRTGRGDGRCRAKPIPWWKRDDPMSQWLDDSMTRSSDDSMAR